MIKLLGGILQVFFFSLSLLLYRYACIRKKQQPAFLSAIDNTAKKKNTTKTEKKTEQLTIW